MNNITNPIHTQRHVSSNPANIGQAEVNPAVAQVQHSSSIPTAIPEQGDLGRLSVNRPDSTFTQHEKNILKQIKEEKPNMAVPAYDEMDEEMRQMMANFNPYSGFCHYLMSLAEGNSSFKPSEAFLNSAYYIISQRKDLHSYERIEAANKISNEAIKHTVLDAINKEFWGAKS